MSHIKDLDEYTDAQLGAEVIRRIEQHENGNCTYCERPVQTSACKFPDRHTPKAPHPFGTLFDMIAERFGPSSVERVVTNNLHDVQTRTVKEFPTCGCKPGFPHEPDCPTWDMPS